MHYFKKVIFCGFLLYGLNSVGQNYSSQTVFSHNDYAQKEPFYRAYKNRVGYMEADVFLTDNQLMVAHYQNQIKSDRTLQAMYLLPLSNEVNRNGGWVYPDSTLVLNFMVDLKTEGISTLRQLVSQLNNYPQLLKARGLEIFISGNVPSPDLWNQFPSFIHFDGRPGVKYTTDQLSRISLISTNFSDYSKWNGKGEIPVRDKHRLDSLISATHAKGKKIRFWSAPDLENGWDILKKLNVDIIGTDNVSGLIQFLKGSSQ